MRLSSALNFLEPVPAHDRILQALSGEREMRRRLRAEAAKSKVAPESSIGQRGRSQECTRAAGPRLTPETLERETAGTARVAALGVIVPGKDVEADPGGMPKSAGSK